MKWRPKAVAEFASFLSLAPRNGNRAKAWLGRASVQSELALARAPGKPVA